MKAKTAAATAITGLMALGIATTSMTATAADNEKCYGVIKAGKNDCQTANSSCAGTSTADNQGDAWVYMPEGLCTKIVGGSLKPKA